MLFETMLLKLRVEFDKRTIFIQSTARLNFPSSRRVFLSRLKIPIGTTFYLYGNMFLPTVHYASPDKHPSDEIQFLEMYSSY